MFAAAGPAPPGRRDAPLFPSHHEVPMLRTLILTALATLWVDAAGAQWAPPADPDPSGILQSAAADTRAGHHARALDKFEWFHAHALEIQPSLYGVRLSFALSYWHALAETYPPALAALRAARDRARDRALAGTEARANFHDMEAINSTLGDHAATRVVFEQLHRTRPRVATRVFDLAQPALVREGAHALLGVYVDPDADFQRLLARYEESRTLAEDPDFGAEQLDFAHRSFANRSATLVGILVVNDRDADARRIAAAARAAWDDAGFHAQLDRALAGTIPAPWP